VTVESPPFNVDPFRPRSIGRRLVAVVGMLALVFLGLTFLHDPHASTLDSPQPEVAAIHHDGPCPGTAHEAAGPGHCCAGIHGHACCMLIEPDGFDAAAPKEPWSQAREPHLAAVVIAPVPRPPAYLAA
jgi:hypothetical protein